MILQIRFTIKNFLICPRQRDKTNRRSGIIRYQPVKCPLIMAVVKKRRCCLFLLQVLVGVSVNHVFRTPAPAPQNEADSLRRPAPFYWNIIAGQVDWLSIPGHLINNQHCIFVVILTKTIYMQRINIIIHGYCSRFFYLLMVKNIFFTFFKCPTWRTVGFVWEKYCWLCVRKLTHITQIYNYNFDLYS